MDESYAITIDDDTSFSQYESPFVLEHFVCGKCHGDLHEVYVPIEARVLVVCFEHGNVCFCGRVTKATVSIELERSLKKYHFAIRALPDLWGELINEGFDRDLSFRIIKDHVCGVCGGHLVPQARAHDSNTDIHCPQHGNINICGYVKKSNFRYNFQAIRAWEKSHRKGVRNANF